MGLKVMLNVSDVKVIELGKLDKEYCEAVLETGYRAGQRCGTRAKFVVLMGTGTGSNGQPYLCGSHANCAENIHHRLYD